MIHRGEGEKKLRIGNVSFSFVALKDYVALNNEIKKKQLDLFYILTCVLTLASMLSTNAETSQRTFSLDKRNQMQ